MLLAAAVATTALVACSQPSSPGDAMEAYWESVRLSDWESTWSMEQASALGIDDPYHYYQRMKAAWPIIGLKLGTPVVDGRDAEVTVEVTRALPILDLSLPKQTALIDRWLWVEGRWLHVETVEKPNPLAEAPSAGQGGDQLPAEVAAEDARVAEGSEPSGEAEPE